MSGRLSALLAALAAYLLPAAVWACPYCAGNNQNEGAFLWVLGALVLLPFPTVGAVIWYIRRTDEPQEEDQPELVGEEDDIRS